MLYNNMESEMTPSFLDFLGEGASEAPTIGATEKFIENQLFTKSSNLFF